MGLHLLSLLCRPQVLHVHIVFVFQAFVMTGDRMINLAKTPANIGTPSYHEVYYLSWALLVHERELVPQNCLSSMTHLYPELSPGRD